MEKQKQRKNRIQDGIKIIKSHGGKIRMAEAIASGISRYALYSLRDKGIIEQISRGIYRLAEMPSISDPDLVTVALRAPRSVVCLISAMAFHEMTTQVPHEVSIALLKGAETPRIDSPPISVYRFSRTAFEAGIEEHSIDGINVRVYSPEKTLADCFKFRNRLGMDVVLEALKLYKKMKPFKTEDLLKYARICRVEKVIRPYLEAII
jgi:predicted transcriptional regulator of viral defense system